MKTKEVKITIPKGYEIDKENSTSECIKFKKIHQITTWKDIPKVNGCYISNCNIVTGYEGKPCKKNKNVYLTDKYAKSALALAQISQLMPYYGGEITNEEWNNKSTKRYGIGVSRSIIYKIVVFTARNILTFHTEEQLDRFMSFPENIQLVKDLYMID